MVYYCFGIFNIVLLSVFVSFVILFCYTILLYYFEHLFIFLSWLTISFYHVLRTKWRLFCHCQYEKCEYSKGIIRICICITMQLPKDKGQKYNTHKHSVHKNKILHLYIMRGVYTILLYYFEHLFIFLSWLTISFYHVFVCSVLLLLLSDLLVQDNYIFIYHIYWH
jgi:hypothetical protein